MDIKIKKVLIQTGLGFKELLPLLVGIVLIIFMLKVSGLINTIVGYLPDNFLGVLVADVVGSLTTGNAINSYIIASSFGKLDQHILVISAFLIAWVTVGIIQLPAEMYFFGKKFAIKKNLQLLEIYFLLFLGLLVHT